MDIDFYIRVLSHENPAYVSKALVKIGISDEQVTRTSFRQGSIEIPESFRLLNKTGLQHLRNMLVYDAWWRLLRNLHIRGKDDFIHYRYTGTFPSIIVSMINWQKKISPAILRMGLVSKCLMWLHY